jgi:uncharacterized protein
LTEPTWRRVSWLSGAYAICRLDPSAPLPELHPSDGGDGGHEPERGRGFVGGALFSATRTAAELSIVCPEEDAPPGGRCEPGWRAMSLEGPIPFETTGVLAALASALGAAGISIFAVSTFDTDYLLVRGADAVRAEAALVTAGFRFDGGG